MSSISESASLTETVRTCRLGLAIRVFFPMLISTLDLFEVEYANNHIYESFATVGEIRVYWRADFQSGSRVLKKVF